MYGVQSDEKLELALLLHTILHTETSVSDICNPFSRSPPFKPGNKSSLHKRLSPVSDKVSLISMAEQIIYETALSFYKSTRFLIYQVLFHCHCVLMLARVHYLDRVRASGRGRFQV